MKNNKQLIYRICIIFNFIFSAKAMEEIVIADLVKKTVTTAMVTANISHSLSRQDLGGAVIGGLEGFSHLPVGSGVAYQAIINQQSNPLGLALSIVHYMPSKKFASAEMNSSVEALLDIKSLGGQQLAENIASQVNDMHHLVKTALNGNRIAQIELCNVQFALDKFIKIGLSAERIQQIDARLHILNDSFQYYQYELLKCLFNQHGEPLREIDIDKCARIYTQWIAQISINNSAFIKHIKYLADHDIPGFKTIYYNIVKANILTKMARGIGQSVYLLGKTGKEWVAQLINPDIIKNFKNTIKDNHVNCALIEAKSLLLAGDFQKAYNLAEKFESTSHYGSFGSLFDEIFIQSEFYSICEANQSSPLIQEIYSNARSTFFSDPQETAQYLINLLSTDVSEATAHAYNLFFDQKGILNIYKFNRHYAHQIPAIPNIGNLEFTQQRLLLNQLVRIPHIQSDHALMGVHYIEQSILNPQLETAYCNLAQATINALSENENPAILSCVAFLEQAPSELKVLEHYVLEKTNQFLQEGDFEPIQSLHTLWDKTLKNEDNALEQLSTQLNSEYSPEQIAEIYQIQSPLEDLTRIDESSVDLIHTDRENKYDVELINSAQQEFVDTIYTTLEPYDTADTDALRIEKYEQRYTTALEKFRQVSPRIQDLTSQQKLFDALMHEITCEYERVYESFPRMVIKQIAHNITHPSEFARNYFQGMYKTLLIIGELSGGDSILNTPLSDIMHEAEVVERLSDRLVKVMNWYDSLNSHQRKEFWATFSADFITALPVNIATNSAFSTFRALYLPNLKLFPQYGGLVRGLSIAMREAYKDIRSSPLFAECILRARNLMPFKQPKFAGIPDLPWLKMPDQLLKMSAGSSRMPRGVKNKLHNPSTIPGNFIVQEFSKEVIEAAVKYAMTNTKIKHFFGKPMHNLGPLVAALGHNENVIRAIIHELQGKIFCNQIMDELKVHVAGYDVYVCGRIIDGVPMLGTFYINL